MQLNQALAKWLTGVTLGKNPDWDAEFLGIVVKGLANHVHPAKAYVKKALAIARTLVADAQYLGDYDEPAKRKAALKKEIAQLDRVLGGKAVSPRTKLTTGLFESLAKASTQRKRRPSPADSATSFKPGTRKKGNDGRLWQVTLTKAKVHRWTRV